ncbi:MAG: hypothetical protein K0U98_27460 [Deltaproteobacteria bacterium]|nr:hypothetical protein [Deltaproteobacteria bacterium]
MTRMLVDDLNPALPKDVLEAVDVGRNYSWAPSDIDMLLWKHGAKQELDIDELVKKYTSSAADALGEDALEVGGTVPPEPPSLTLLKASALSNSPVKYPLERWLIQAHAYEEGQAAKIGILGRLFSGQLERVKAGVIHDAKRFSVIETSEGRSVEFGVAIRLSVATSKVTGEMELTLPNLAAEAQLHNTDTRIGITVTGYVGPLGALLPAPRKLNVETCIEYTEAFRKIQALVFGEAGWPHVSPTILSYETSE